MEVAGHVSTVTTIRDSTQVGEARRAVQAMARDRGLGETATGNASIVVTELVNNLVRHAGEGSVALRWQGARGCEALEMVVLDRGPGMADIEKCMADGYSTRGSPGTGLGAVRRLSDEFDVQSTPGKGTAIVSRFYLAPRPREGQPRRLRYAVHCTPAPGETECGDIWRVATRDNHAAFLVADGLGHGPAAALASRAVASVFDRNFMADPARFLEEAHAEVGHTRGAAVAALVLDLASGAVRYAGVGNIAGSIIADGVGKGLFSHNGTLGAQMRKAQEFAYAWPPGALLVMHSDGIQSRWSLADYPGLAQRDPALIAALLARDFRRGHDDVTVLVARLERAR
jgi:anti-sigma regulatory factor (Ser/Thr protein kinase)